MSTAPDKKRVEYLLELMRDQLALGRSLDNAKRKFRIVFSDDEIEEASKSFIEEQQEAGTKSTIVQLPNDFEGWYSGAKESANSHWSLLKSVLKQKAKAWNSEMVASLDASSDNVMGLLAPPKSEQRNVAKGLVLGYIQSGKTANFSAVIAKAVDEGYRLVVVLSGMHNNLRLQTQHRLHEELVNPANGETCTTLTDVDEKGDFKKKQTVSANRALSRRDGFTLVVLKKNSYVLRNFNAWLSGARKEVLERCPLLVIDDESDQASVNTSSPENNPTAINNHIHKLLDYPGSVSYIGYTATPFANVLIDSTLPEDLYPKDFVVSIEKPACYFGPEELFGRDDVNGDKGTDGLPVIRHVPDEDAILFKAKRGKGGFVAPELDSLPSSLKTAIDSFILSSAARMKRGQWREHMTMLVHVSHLIAVQEKTKRIIDEYVQAMKFKAQEHDDELMSHFKQQWNEDHEQLCSRFQSEKQLSFEDISDNSIKVIEPLETILENSASSERLTFTGPERLRAIVF